MTRYVWDLSGLDEQCESYGPGHQVHWVQFNQSMRHPAQVIPVTARVDGDGLVHIDAHSESLVRWNHRPELVRVALERFGGCAEWKPRWRLLVVPMESIVGGPHSVLSMATTDQQKACDARQPEVTGQTV